MAEESTDKISSTPEISAEELRAQRARARLEHAEDEDKTNTPQDKNQQRRAYGSISGTKQAESSYQSLLFGSAGTIEKPAWSDSTKGRLFIRMFTRGVLGAALFTLGGRISRIQLQDYNAREFKFTWDNIKEKPLQGIAKGFDEVFGKPIAGIARATTNTKGMTAAEAKIARGNAEWDATNFRQASYYFSGGGKLDHKGRPMNARSLGAEMVAVSFDFAMMSIGDGMGRNLIQMIDPNIRKTWMVNDKGEKAKEGEKSHFNLHKFLRSQGLAAWRILSKNQGEDWAVALPYVYQMRFQRNMLGKMFGNQDRQVKVVLDHAWNGGAYKVNAQGKIIGDYQLLGAIDLHSRFVGYNVYTLMFREGYDAIGNKLKQWKHDGYPIHLSLPHEIHPIDGIRDAVRYVTKSTIKANLYMNPAVVPFWLMRVPQSKWRGALMNTEAAIGENAIASKIPFSERLSNAFHGNNTAMNAEEVAEKMVIQQPGGNPIYNFSATRHRVLPGRPGHFTLPGTTAPADASARTMYLGDRKVNNPLYGAKGPNDYKLYENYEKGFSTTFSKALNPFGAFSYWLGGKATKLSHMLPEGKLKDLISVDESKALVPTADGRETFVRNMVDASLAYTPYFFAKTEFGLRVDDTPSSGGRGNMDNAIYKLIDNVCALKPAATVTSVKQVWKLATHLERPVVMREGNENHPDKPTLKIPSTLVQAEGRKTDRAPHIRQLTTETDAAQDKRWAESVTGKNLTAHYQESDSHTRH